MGEFTLKAYAQRAWNGSGVLRYFTVYGPRGVENHAVIAMIARAFWDRTRLRFGATARRYAIGFLACQNRASTMSSMYVQLRICEPSPQISKRVLSQESPRNHRNHRIDFPRRAAINREVPAGRRSHSMLFGVRLQRELTHQLGPAVRVVCVVRSVGQIFGEINLFVNIRLPENSDTRTLTKRKRPSLLLPAALPQIPSIQEKN